MKLRQRVVGNLISLAFNVINGIRMLGCQLRRFDKRLDQTKQFSAPLHNQFTVSVEQIEILGLPRKTLINSLLPEIWHEYAPWRIPPVRLVGRVQSPPVVCACQVSWRSAIRLRYPGFPVVFQHPDSRRRQTP